ncbi:MAG: hypothetical protein ACUVX8_09110 [Candidatus Zipacnadales bacterium]
MFHALTLVAIVGDDFYINGHPTYEGRKWEGHRVEGLLLNSRMVQAIFDDENPETRPLWAYPDTGEWDPERNTREFIAAMPEWRVHGLLSFTVNLQGGGPIYTKPWPYDHYLNSAYDSQGNLKAVYMDRLARIFRRADELGMAPILSLSYFGIDHRFIEGPNAVRTLADNVIDWLTEQGFTNVLLEITNERMEIATKTGKVSALELIPRMRERWKQNHPTGPPLYLSTSHGGGGALPPKELVAIADFVILHGNGQSPQRHVEMIDATRRIIAEVRGTPTAIPIVFNEAGPWWEVDQMDKWMEAFKECVRRHVSWGYFTQGTGTIQDGKRVDRPYVSGYQTPPVNWNINTKEKRRFFTELQAITGGL